MAQSKEYLRRLRQKHGLGEYAKTKRVRAVPEYRKGRRIGYRREGSGPLYRRRKEVKLGL